MAQGGQLVRDVVTHDQSEDLSDVAMLSKQQVELLPPPGHILTGMVGTESHLRRTNTQLDRCPRRTVEYR